jgi:phage shock protein B
MEDTLVPIVCIGSIFVGMPWIILHYVTKWKSAATLTGEDESLLDQLHYTARQLEERLATIERIVSADNPDFRPSRPSVPPLRAPDESAFDRRN